MIFILFKFFKIILDFHNQYCDCSDTNTCIKYYRRFKSKQHIIYHSLAYTKRQSSVSYFIKYGSLFGAIIVFFRCSGRQYAIVRRHSIKTKFSDYFMASNYYDILSKSIDSFFYVLENLSYYVDVIDVNSITDMCILMEDEDTYIVSPISGSHEHD